MPLSMRLPVYVVVALVVTILWGNWAETERPPKPGLGPRHSIVGIANGTAESPFVQRRLLADSARVLAWLVPSRMYSASATVASLRIVSMFVCKYLFARGCAR